VPASTPEKCFTGYSNFEKNLKFKGMYQEKCFAATPIMFAKKITLALPVLAFLTKTMTNLLFF